MLLAIEAIGNIQRIVTCVSFRCMFNANNVATCLLFPYLFHIYMQIKVIWPPVVHTNQA